METPSHQLLDAVIAVCIDEPVIKPEWILTVCTYMTGLEEYFDVPDWFKLRVNFVGQRCKYMGDDFFIANMRLEDPLASMMNCAYGLAERPAEEIVLRYAPEFWQSLIKAFDQDLHRQLQLELVALKKLWEPKPDGLYELFNRYMADREDAENVISVYPKTAAMVEWNSEYKRLINQRIATQDVVQKQNTGNADPQPVGNTSGV